MLVVEFGILFLLRTSMDRLAGLPWYLVVEKEYPARCSPGIEERADGIFCDNALC